MYRQHYSSLLQLSLPPSIFLDSKYIDFLLNPYLQSADVATTVSKGFNHQSDDEIHRYVKTAAELEVQRITRTRFSCRISEQRQPPGLSQDRQATDLDALWQRSTMFQAVPLSREQCRMRTVNRVRRQRDVFVNVKPGILTLLTM